MACCRTSWRRTRCYPLRLDGNRLDVAMATPEDGFLLKALRLATGLEIRPFIALAERHRKGLVTTGHRRGGAG